MAGEVSGPYRFPDLPLEPVRPGTRLLVSGPPHSGVERFARRLITGEDDATLVVSTDASCERVVDDLAAVEGAPAPDRVGVVDCSGTDGAVDGCLSASVNGPRDLTGLGIRYADLYRRLRERTTRVRSGVFTVTTLLSIGEFRPVSRFVHAIGGRSATADGLGVFVFDPSTQDERVGNTIAGFCDGVVSVRDGADGPELRVRGLADQPREWTAV